MSSNVGSSNVYEAGDQRNTSSDQAERFNEGKANAHNNLDSKDSRSIANKLESHTKGADQSDAKSREKQLLDEDATLPARAHGNEPSRGAKIDQQIREEEAEILKKKEGKN